MIAPAGGAWLARRLGALNNVEEALSIKLSGLEFRLRRMEAFRAEHEILHSREFDAVEQMLSAPCPHCHKERHTA